MANASDMTFHCEEHYSIEAVRAQWGDYRHPPIALTGWFTVRRVATAERLYL